MTTQYKNLMEVARSARENAHAPFSGYKVGAALLAADGRSFTGCNIECSSLGLTMCAERVALFKALSEGARSFAALAVTAGEGGACRLCGACRQTLWDFAPDLVVITEDENGQLKEQRLAALLPEAFDRQLLSGE
jgi:cytidine deaminase